MYMATIHCVYIRPCLVPTYIHRCVPACVIFNSNEIVDVFEKEKKFPLNDDNNVHSTDSPL